MPTVDLEQVAALLDGRLNASQRERLIAELANAPELLGVVADAASILDGPADARRLADISGPRSNWRRAWMWGAAAAVLVASVVSLVVWKRGRPATDDPARFVAMLDSRAAAGYAMPPRLWSNVRGESGGPSPGRAVRLGALLVDLRLSRVAGDTTSRRLALEIAALLDNMPASAPVAAEFRSLESHGSGQGDLALRHASADAAALAGPERAELGAFLETARIAAQRRDTSFFRRADTRQRFGAASGAADAPQAALNALTRIRRRFDGDDGFDFNGIERDLEAALRAFGD